VIAERRPRREVSRTLAEACALSPGLETSIGCRTLGLVTKRFRDRLRAYWWLWALIVVAAVILNEVFDREVAGDKNGHPAGGILVAIVVVLIVLMVWDLVTRKSRSA
jgi:uncharacterized membrane protein YhaH (DUF805 family)